MTSITYICSLLPFFLALFHIELCLPSKKAHFVGFLCKMNTSFENVVNLEVDETTILEKVLAFIAWILLQFPCNGMMLGLIQFERLGGDPLKRRLSDQLVSNVFWFWIIANILETWTTLEIVLEITEPCSLKRIKEIFIMSNFLLTVMEITAIKYWLRFIRKRLISMDDNFMYLSLSIQNIVLSTLFSVSKFVIGDMEELYQEHKKPDQIFKIGQYLMIPTGTLLVIYVLRCLLNRFSEWYHKNIVNPMEENSFQTISSNVQEEDKSAEVPTPKINNLAYNPEVSTRKFKLFVIFLYFLAFLPMHLVIWQNDYSYITEFVFKLFYKLGLSNLITSIIVPLYFYLTNEPLRKFAYEYFSFL